MTDFDYEYDYDAVVDVPPHKIRSHEKIMKGEIEGCIDGVETYEVPSYSLKPLGVLYVATELYTSPHFT